MNRFERLERLGLVRFKVEGDDHTTLEDLAGDCFNPEIHSNIDPDTLGREYKEFADRVHREGVYGIVGEYNIGRGWEHADSVWGFVGNDYENSGYDDYVRQDTVSALREAILNRCRYCMGTGVK